MTLRVHKKALSLGTALGVTLGIAAPAMAQDNAPATSTAQAQPAPAAAPDASSPDVIVTARRTEERLQEVPISITVFNQKQLTDRNVVDASDLANFTPSLSANANFGTENTSFAIRGFVQDAGTAPSVGTYFADVVALRGPTQGTQAGDSVGPGSFFDLQNVQVLKGPQGTLFGRNTTGGAVLLVPQRPTDELGGYVEGSYGNYNMWRVQGALNIPLGEDARFRIAADHEQRDGYLINKSGIGPSAYNNVNYIAVRASLVVDLTSRLENYTIVSYSRSNTNGSVEKMIGCNPAGYNPVDPLVGSSNFIGVLSCSQLAAEKAAGFGFYDLEASVADPVSRLTQWQVINTTTWRASDTITIKNIASYGQFTDLQRSPLFGTNWTTANTPFPYPFVFFAGVPRTFTGVFPIPNGNTADQYTFTDEVQLQGSAAGGKLTYQGGAYFEYSGPLGLVGNQSPQLLSCTDVAALACSDPIGAALTAGAGFPVNVGAVNYTAGETTYRDVGLYAQASYSLTDQLKLTGGIRYTWDRQSNIAQRISYHFPVVPPYIGAATASCTDPSTAPNCSETLSQKASAPTWLAGIDYKPTEDILLYAKYTRGYRAGGVFTNAPIDHRTFAPEKVDSYEAGFKTTWRGAVHGTFNASFFYNDLSNQQIQFGFDARVTNGIPAPVSPTTAILNAGRSRIYGAEVEASLTPFRGFTLDGSYTYLNATIRNIATFTTIDPNYQAQVSTIAPGSPLVLSPKNKFTITGGYTLPLDHNVGRITISATYTHTDKQLTSYAYQDPATLAAFGSNLGLLGARDLVNLNLDWDSVANSPVDLSIFATNVTNQQYYAFVPGLASSGSEYAVLGEPRMYGVRARIHFGK